MGNATKEEQRETRRLCSQVAILTRWGRYEEADAARTALAVARARAVLTDLVETHPITSEQRACLAAALD